jgi:signal peptidase I
VTAAERLAAAVKLIRRLVIAAALLIGVGLLVVTRGCTRWPETFVGSGPSMEPTVRPGDYFTVWPMPERSSDLTRGMLVIFRFVHEDTVYHVLRRLAALPGDTIAMREGGAVVNGSEMAWPGRIVEPRARRSELARVDDLYTWGPVVVPNDSVFLLSDTRDMVGWPDSRFIGPVPLGALEGVAGRYLWARDRGRILRRLR